jgi:hypothetical protein
MHRRHLLEPHAWNAWSLAFFSYYRQSFVVFCFLFPLIPFHSSHLLVGTPRFFIPLKAEQLGAQAALRVPGADEHQGWPPCACRPPDAWTQVSDTLMFPEKKEKKRKMEKVLLSC